LKLSFRACISNVYIRSATFALVQVCALPSLTGRADIRWIEQSLKMHVDRSALPSLAIQAEKQFREILASVETNKKKQPGPNAQPLQDPSPLDTLPAREIYIEPMLLSHLTFQESGRELEVGLAAKETTQSLHETTVAGISLDSKELHAEILASLEATHQGTSAPPEEVQAFLEDLPEHLKVRAERVADLSKVLADEFKVNREKKIRQTLEQYSLQEPPLIAAANTQLVQQRIFNESLLNTKQSVKEGTETESGTPSVQSAAGTITSLTGPFQLGAGLIWVPQYRFQVEQRAEGRVVAQGAIDPAQGTFKIPIRKNDGQIVIELKDERDETIGRGTYALSAITKGQANTLAQPIKLERTGYSTFVAAHDRNKIGKNDSGINEASVLLNESTVSKTNTNGVAKMGEWLDSSSFVVRLDHEAYFPTTTISMQSSLSEIPMLSEKLVETFLPNDRTYRRNHGAHVWGVVEENGTKLRGAKVFLVGESGRIEANYPQSDNEMTNGWGLFHFSNVKPGDYFISAQIDHRDLGSRMAKLEAGRWTPIMFDVGSGLQTEMLIYDGLTGNPLEGALSFVPSQRQKSFSLGRIKLRIASGPDVAPIQTQVPGYWPHNAVKLRSSSVNQWIPMVSESWFAYLNQNYKTNIDKKLSVLAGFLAEGETFLEASLPQGFSLLYFNSQGRVVKADDPSCIGFLAYGQPEGIFTIEFASPKQASTSSSEILVRSSHVVLAVNGEVAIRR